MLRICLVKDVVSENRTLHKMGSRSIKRETSLPRFVDAEEAERHQQQAEQSICLFDFETAAKGFYLSSSRCTVCCCVPLSSAEMTLLPSHTRKSINGRKTVKELCPDLLLQKGEDSCITFHMKEQAEPLYKIQPILVNDGAEEMN